MVSEFALSVVARVFEPQLLQTKDYRNGIYRFPAKHVALMRDRAKTY
jgi:hypothetical protein